MVGFWKREPDEEERGAAMENDRRESILGVKMQTKKGRRRLEKRQETKRKDD